MTKLGRSQSDMALRKARILAFGSLLLLAGWLPLVIQLQDSLVLQFDDEHAALLAKERQPEQFSIPLRELVATHEICQEPLVRFNDSVLDKELAYADHRNIPRIIHVTSKTRCVTPRLAAHLEKWRLPEHSLFFHDDEAVYRLLSRHWDEFPHLAQISKCVLGGASRADLWRALVIWEYGGIYSDIDNAPNFALANGTAILPEDEAFFLVERDGVASQYFFAATPRHPLIYLLVTQILLRLLGLPDIDNQWVPIVTGPGALKVAWVHFMNKQNLNSDYPAGFQRIALGSYERFERIREGTYTGQHNRTARLVGNTTSNEDWVVRFGLESKERDYASMNMTHFSKEGRVDPGSSFRSESCLQHIYRITELPKLTDNFSRPW